MNSHLGGSGAPGNGPGDVAMCLRPSDSSFEASFNCVRHTEEKYSHLKNEAPPPSFDNQPYLLHTSSQYKLPPAFIDFDYQSLEHDNME